MLHQRTVLDWAYGRDRVGLFLEMRLGKTLVAIRWAQSFSPRRVLIVSPLTVIPTWVEELELERERARVLDGPVKQRREDARRGGGWFVTNYETIRLAPEIAGYPWDVVVADESTVIRNPKAQVTKVFLRNFGHVPYRAVLTGLPAPESLQDYWSQMAFLHDGWMGHVNFWAWRKAFFVPDAMGWDWRPAKGTTRRVRTEVERSAFVMRRTDVGLGAKKIYEKRSVELPPRERAKYRRLRDEFEYDEVQTKWTVARLTWLARLAGGFNPLGQVVHRAKADELLRLLRGELAEESVVVWFRFRTELDLVQKALQSSRIDVGRIDGKVGRPERERVVKAFRVGQVRVVLCQVRCARFGLNFAKSSTAIYYSNTFDSEDRSQSEDRIVLPTKKEPLLYIDLVAKGTIDEDVREALRFKKSMSKVAMIDFLSRRMGWLSDR